MANKDTKYKLTKSGSMDWLSVSKLAKTITPEKKAYLKRTVLAKSKKKK